MSECCRQASRGTEGGMALVLVLVFTGLLMVLGVALAGYALNERNIAAFQAEDVKKRYLAESAVEAGIAALCRDFHYDREIRGTLEGEPFTVVFSDSDQGRRLLTARSQGDRHMIELVVVVEMCPLQGVRVVEWIKP